MRGLLSIIRSDNSEVRFGRLRLKAGSGIALDESGEMVTVRATGVTGTAAPTSATYITQTGHADLSAEQALSSLATGVVKVTNGTGVLSTAVANTDYAAATHEARHTSGGADPFLSTDLLEAIVKRLQTSTGPTTLTIGAVADGEFLKRSGSSIIGGSASGGGAAFTTVEVSLGAAPQLRRSGSFQITGLSGLTIGKPVLIQQASGPYTGKGMRADEAEMDMLVVTGKVLSATAIQCYWQAACGRVRGNFKFDYLVGA